MVGAGGAVVVAIAALTGGSLYWTGYIGDRQGVIAQEINTQLGSKGLGNVKVLVDKQWRATAEGLVASATEKDLALAMIREHRQLKEPISDLIRVRPTRAELQAILDKAAADTGIPQASAQIDDSLTTITVGGADLGPETRPRIEQALNSALSTTGTSTQVRFVYTAPSAPTAVAAPPTHDETMTQALNEQLHAAALSGVSAEFAGAGRVRLQGTVSSPEQHDRAVQIAASQAGVSGVIDLMQVAAPPPAATSRDPAKLEGEINRALRGNGLGGITALVADDFSVTLKGSANSAGNKSRAFQLVRQFPVQGSPKDRVFVVE
ncbi:MAG: BON domain-containing protein [Candidatus Accumulibacter phosphatis]|uniref:BON domain-containing protein n=1 Tax=Candidatus Accumulibacter phosphatis TaxID=327160 RepID=UPI001A6125D8|nr:BON domain-containing protein [Candidatus Accumulibacter phosphatis]